MSMYFISTATIMKSPKNPNDHKKATPKTAGRNKRDDKKFTSYDTSKNETSSPQKVREGNEAEGEQAKLKKSGRSG